MNKVIPFVALLFSSAAFADSSGASASASGAVYQSTQQNNLIGEVIHPYATVGENYASCATDSISIGGIGNYSDGIGSSYSHGGSVGVSYNMVLDTNGANYRCAKQQNAIVRLKQVAYDDKIIAMCLALRAQGVIPDPSIFTWADKCHGLIDSKMLTAFQK